MDSSTARLPSKLATAVEGAAAPIAMFIEAPTWWTRCVHLKQDGRTEMTLHRCSDEMQTILTHRVAEHQKKKEGEQVPCAWPEADHPVGGGSEEARRQHPHGDEIKQHCGREVCRSAIHATGPFPAHQGNHIMVLPQCARQPNEAYTLSRLSRASLWGPQLVRGQLRGFQQSRRRHTGDADTEKIHKIRKGDNDEDSLHEVEDIWAGLVDGDDDCHSCRREASQNVNHPCSIAAVKPCIPRQHGLGTVIAYCSSIGDNAMKSGKEMVKG
ncbi:MAG: hypothetical protein FRX49_04884 [Trebouxia sp. A1-2]|nr:MAG: hypothetical protein FRX49_04884 [Trebouxia sp. A1-2]